MVAICNAENPMAFKAPRTSSQTKTKVSQGIKPGAKDGHKKQSTSSKQPPMSSSEATKGESSKSHTSSKTGPSKKKESCSTKDSNPSHPLVSTPIDTGMHKYDQQAADGPTSLGVTSEEGAHPQLSSGYDALADSTAEVDPGTSAPNDYLPSQQGKDKGTKNYSLNYIFAGTDPNVLADKTKPVSDRLELSLLHLKQEQEMLQN
nr:hypothetical protein [Tanacetum cinerariifolium]